MNSKGLKILAISGSTRKNSTNHKILDLIGNRYHNDFELEIYDGIDKLPHFNPELDGDNLPLKVKIFRDKIENADGVLICTPEYIFSLPGSLKNAIEWNVSTTLFSNKPVAIIVASASGEKAFESLALIMETIEANIPIESRLLIQGAKGKIDAGGQILDSELIEKIDLLMQSFKSSIVN